MGITNSKPQYLGLSILIIIVSLLAFIFYRLHYPAPGQGSRQFILGIVLLLLSTGITVLLLFSVTSIFGYTNFKKGFLNFLIGDNGTYSLSRLQAVLWGIVIMSYQISIIIGLCFNLNGNFFHFYEPVFSETAIWLLGLSLTSSIAVKGITVATNSQNPSIVAQTKILPKLGDVLVGDNGLDFSKCQMLIWTLLAIVTFESKCYFFNEALLTQPKEKIILLLDNYYDEYSPVKQKLDINDPYVPYLPWSFVVLMGLSQGVYVGKKLVPSFKLGDVKASKEQQLVFQTDQLKKKTEILSNILSKTKPSEASAIDKASIQSIRKDVSDAQEKIDAIQGDINQINNYMNG